MQKFELVWVWNFDKFKLSLFQCINLENSDSFDNCYLPRKEVYNLIWKFPQFVIQEGSFGFPPGNCTDYFSTELCSLTTLRGA